MENIINLKKAHIIGVGGYRTIYTHPDNANQCLKVQKHKNYTENNVDIKYYQHLKNRKISFEHIAQFHGVTNTNQGKAVIFTLIKDYDNKISKTLQYYLTQDDEQLDKLIAQKLLALKQYLIKQRIVFVDINPNNIVLCKTSNTNTKLIIIDALASRNLIPIAHHISYIAIKMINRRWHRSINNEYQKFKHRKALKPLFDDVSAL